MPKYLLGDMEKEGAMVEFKSIEEFESAIDIERTAKNLCKGWLSTRTTRRRRSIPSIDWLPLIMYSFGLAYYLIALHAHLFPSINKKWKISEKKAEELASEFMDRIIQFRAIDADNFREDLESLKEVKEDVKRITLDLGSSGSLESVKEILSNKIYNIIRARWKNVRRDLIEYIVDAELRRFRQIEASLVGRM